ncbi:DUF4097 family beta strand repeat-containing protein [Streptomyces sp. NPDC051561]|uniref:DUF4097 family beta strand repeat-containing protein n=1 Tax=Streptomyces sp. NPDC051561 TaxID=3365658 RepID=UPI0037B58E8C
MAVRRTALTTRTLLAAGGAVLLALAATGCGSADAADAPVEKKSFAYGGKALTIEADDSRLELVPADVKDIQVERQVDGWVVLGSGPDPVWELTGNTLKLLVKCTGVSMDCQARHTVKVPRDVALTIKDDNGSVHATGFDTDFKANSDNGAIILKDMRGKLDVESDNGEITGEGIKAKSVTAKSDNGEIELGFSVVPDLVDGHSNNGAIRLTLPKSTYNVQTHTDNGTVKVDVPKSDNSTHLVKARTDNGEVTVQSAN